MRRILSLFLAALMVFGLFNAQVFAGDAAENTQTVTIVKQTGIAGVKIDGELVQGNTVDLAPGQHTAVAVPEDGYVFKQWKIGFSAINDAELTFNVPDVKRITITGAIAVRYFNFVDDEWQLLNTKYPNNKGQVTLLKEATANMVLNEWNTAEDGSGTSYTPGQSITVTRSLDLYAQESPIAATRALRINAGRGVNRSTVTINGQKRTSLNAVAVGDRVTITATPSKPADYEISAWASIDYKYGATTYVSTDLENIDDDTPGVFSFDMPDANIAIQVSASMIGTRDVFIIPDDTIASVTGAGTYDINGEVTLTATPAEGYGAIYWRSIRTSVDEVACVASMQHRAQGDEYTFSMPKYNLALQVSAKPAEHTVTYVVDNEVWKTVGFDTGATINAVRFPPSKAGSTFIEWNTAADGSGDAYAAGAQISPTADIILYAIYEDSEKDYFISVSRGGLGIKTVSGYSGKFKSGDTVTITTTVYDGYENPVWTPTAKTVNGREYSDQGVDEYTGYTYTFTMPANNVAFDLTAQPKRYRLYVDVQDGVNLTSTTPDYVTAGTSVTVSAEPEDGYSKVMWQSVAGEFDGQTFSSSFLFSGSETYTFDMPKSPVALRVSAKSEQAQTYTVTWKDWDGTVLETDTGLEAGVTPSYDGEEPARTATAEYTYTFDGWTPAISPVSRNISYTATYIQTRNTFTITWNNYDGSLIKTTQVEYGVIPSYDGITPTRPATAQNSFVFSGWVPARVGATADATYTAAYTETTNKYTVTWENYNGTVLETDTEVPAGTTPEYNGAIPTKPATAEYTFAFSGWSPSIDAVTADVVYTAQFTSTRNSYTITWNNYDGSLITTTQVEYGQVPAYTGETPTRTPTATINYTFNGWTPALASVTGTATYTATYSESERKYTVTWKNDNDTTIYTEQVSYNATPVFNDTDYAIPTKTDDAEYTYTFTSWMPPVAPVTGDVTYRPVFTATPLSVHPISHHADSPTMYFLADTGSLCKDRSVTLLTEVGAASMFFPDALRVYDGQYELPLTFNESFTEDDWQDAVNLLFTYPQFYVSQTGKFTTGWGYEANASSNITIADADTVSISDFTVEADGNIYVYAQFDDALYIDYHFQGGTLSDDGDDYLSDSFPVMAALFNGELTSEHFLFPMIDMFDDAIEDVLGDPDDLFTAASGTLLGWSTSTDAADLIDRTQTDDIDYSDIASLNLTPDADGVVHLYATWQGTPELIIHANFPAAVTNGNITSAGLSVAMEQDPAVTAANIAAAGVTFDNDAKTINISLANGETASTSLGSIAAIPYEYNGSATSMPIVGTISYLCLPDYLPESPTSSDVSNVIYSSAYTATACATTANGANPRNISLSMTLGDFGPDANGNYNIYMVWATQYRLEISVSNFTFPTLDSGLVNCLHNEMGCASAIVNSSNNKLTLYYDGPDSIVTFSSTAYNALMDPGYIFDFPSYGSGTDTSLAITLDQPETFATYAASANNTGGSKRIRTYLLAHVKPATHATVRWIYGNGDIIKIDPEVPIGTTPEYIGETPAIESSYPEQYTLRFTGWSPEPAPITGDAVYRAVFATDATKHPITWQDTDGSVFRVDMVDYGTTPQYTGTVPDKIEDGETYSFTRWYPTPTQVTGPATYTAMYQDYSPAKTGSLIEFGQYPASLVDDADLLAELNSLSLNWQSYNYYRTVGSSAPIQDDYMQYADVSLGDNTYRAVRLTIDAYRPLGLNKWYSYTSNWSHNEAGDVAANPDYSFGSVYWFKYEPITWVVLDSSTGLIMTKDILDAQRFNAPVQILADSKWYVGGSTGDYYASSWRHSLVRSWLNDAFYATAFSGVQTHVKETEVITSTPHATTRTQDRVFLVDLDALADNANFQDASAHSPRLKEDVLVASGTDYAASQGLVSTSTGNAAWMTRDSTSHAGPIMVEADGDLTDTVYQSYYNGLTGVYSAYWQWTYTTALADYIHGVRPCVTVDLQSAILSQSAQIIPDP